MLKIETKLIEGAISNPDTEAELRKTMGIDIDVAINPMVFEVNYNNKKYYCCWSGGSIVNNEPAFTLLGQAALEGLINLPLGNNDSIKLQELKIGQTPLRSKIKKVLKKNRANTKICFFGDMSGELDGHMTSAFNLVEGKISL
ncbi:hypothetical protein [Pseudoalteromonas obscura]|uniref:Uncharacterized protein n=1 Tax=Pseudoalteromonas obscura TaxID=3048491 RepID=A0ABT7EH49_9GAMM|nr:hypothetical protein [Pseudoalteromonas sp. P94(2023)]MDK2594371.1 hypothetical protein [Pseudoalteromonas sp. P94(2023)]